MGAGIAIAQFASLGRPRARPRRNDRSRLVAGITPDFDFDRRLTAAIENLASMYAADEWHGGLLSCWN